MTDKITPDVFERFAKVVQTAPEMLDCHMVAGGFDYLVKAGRAGDTDYAVMKEVKRDALLPVG